MAKYIHGDTDPVESDRLEKQARFLARWILEGLELGPHTRLLDLACGTGAMARRLRAQLPDVKLLGCDLSLKQLKEAKRSSGGDLPLASADAALLPFRDQAFDGVHCSWLLEHVPPPRVPRVLREVRRVLRPSCLAWFCEVENDSLFLWPRLPLVEESFREVWRAQAEGGGDPIIGRKMHGLCAEAGFRRVEVLPTTLHVHGGSPPGYYRASLQEFCEILQSAEASLPARLRSQVGNACEQLMGLHDTPGSSFTYSFFRVRAER